MKIYDLSTTIHPGLVIYPGDPAIEIDRAQGIERGDTANVSLLRLGVHTGTHVDAPVHLFPDAPGADALPLDALIGPARLVEIQTRSAIGPGELWSTVPPDTERLLIKTRNSELWNESQFKEDFVYLTVEAARWLVDRGIRLVGIDYLSVEQFAIERLEVHEALLSSGVVIVEGLDLRSVPPGVYTLICLPLKIRGADGAPARAVLIEPPLVSTDG